LAAFLFARPTVQACGRRALESHAIAGAFV